MLSVPCVTPALHSFGVKDTAFRQMRLGALRDIKDSHRVPHKSTAQKYSKHTAETA
jgi:hypothetical protein